MPEVPITPNNISEKQLKYGYWFVTHKLLLRRIGIIVLIVIDAVLVLYGGFGLVSHYLLDADKQRQFEQELVRVGVSPALHERNAVRPLAIGSTQTLANKDRYDLVATVRNPNPRYVARFSYRFLSGSEASEPQKGFVLPNEEKFVVGLGAQFSSRPASVQLEISELTWQGIDRHKVPDYERFVAEHLNFEVTDIVYDPAFVLNELTVGKTTFNVKNNTGFGYHEVRFLVVMYRGTAIGGVNTHTMASLDPGEMRGGEVTWFDPLPAISQVRVIPEVDIFDDRVYLRQ